jgi:hypothetical protein
VPADLGCIDILESIREVDPFEIVNTIVGRVSILVQDKLPILVHPNLDNILYKFSLVFPSGVAGSLPSPSTQSTLVRNEG